ncbi:IPT/TIG domain-containing protein [Kitasatospora sp. NPDC005748]|uniref:lipase family protein n=1 Tax=Kitasatospora sp. NPDC005748 TaxID=3157063 RepID=UPI0033F32791
MATAAPPSAAAQAAMTLAAIAATAATPRPSGEALADQSTRVARGITLQLADPSLATGGTWVLSWVGLSPDNANMAYLAVNTDGSNTFAVVIRGTDANVTDLLEDLGVGTVVPFTAVGTPPGPVSVAKGAMEAFTEVVTMTSAGVTLVQALTTALRQAPSNPTVHVIGHSLGGAIATMVAPYLRTLTWPDGTPQFSLYTFAAPTAGGTDFATYVNSLKWQANERYYNAYDLVPQAWNNLDEARTWYPDPPGPAANEDVKAVIGAIAGLPGPNVYAQPGDDMRLNGTYGPPGSYDPSVVKKSVQDFMGQVAFQHANSTYLRLLYAPDVDAGPVVTGVSPSTGAPGTQVVISVTGSGFDQYTGVDFGTVPCSQVAIAVLPTGIRISTPAPQGVGVVPVRVTTGLGTSPAVPFGQFAYGGPAPVVVTGIGPDTGESGTSVTITGVNFGSTATVHFGDKASKHVNVSPPDTIVATAPEQGIGVGLGKTKTVNVTVLSNGYSSPAGPSNEFVYEK